MVHTANVHITYRLEKGNALTYQELDDNFRYLDAKPSGGGSGATFDADFDTGFDPEASPDEDIIRLYVGNTIPGYSNVQSIVTLAANGFTMNMGQSNTYAIAVNGNTLHLTSNTNANGTPIAMNGAPIIFIAGTASNTVYHANTKGGDIELRPGNYNKYANVAIANTSTPAAEGVVRVVGPNANTQAIIRFFDSTREEYVGVRSPYAIDGSWILTLPLETGKANQVLVTDGTGATSWQTINALVTEDLAIFLTGTGIAIDNTVDQQYVFTNTKPSQWANGISGSINYNTGGSVGIGTNTPVSTLHVDGTITTGNVHITGAIRDNNGIFGTVDQVLSANGWINTANTYTEPVVIVSSLPASPAAGTRYFVTDSFGPPDFYSVVSGSGANTVPVFYDGADWRIG